MDIITYALCKNLIKKAAIDGVDLSEYAKSQDLQGLQSLVEHNYVTLEQNKVDIKSEILSKLSLSSEDDSTKEVVLSYDNEVINKVNVDCDCDDILIYDGGDLDNAEDDEVIYDGGMI